MANLEEKMNQVDKDMELDEEKESVEQLKAEIDKLLKGLEDFTPKEKIIMDNIQETLKERGLKYSYNQDDPRHVNLDFEMENKPFRMNIILQNGKVIYRLCFPFRVQSNAIPFVTIYMAEFNSDTVFSHMSLDMDNGELTMEYSYLLEDPTRFNKKEFWIYTMSLILPSLEVYTKMAHLSMGMVSGKDRRLYTILLEKALETIKGEYDVDDVSYGVENLKAELSKDSSEIKKTMKNGSTEDVDGDELTDFEFVKSEHASRIFPSLFEEMNRMMGHTDMEENDEDYNHSTSTLSMFAKKTEENETEKAVVGGDSDE